MIPAASGAGGPAGVPLWMVRRAPWFLICLHLPFVALVPTFVITRRPHLSFEAAAVVVAMGLAVTAIQLRHSLAAARGERPRGWAWTFLALTALVYVPMWWYTWDWAMDQIFVAASAAMVLRGWPRIVMVAGPILGTWVVTAYVVGTRDYGLGDQDTLSVVIWSTYYFVLLTMGTAALYGSARLVRTVEELYAARTELAELAVGRERLRVSRDLHDLLGQSLSAVSLKGDLAMRLLPTDAAAARAEIESLTDVARSALRDVRAVARDEHVVSLPAEIDAAATLLDAAGIQTQVYVELADLARPVEEMLAWAVREGATNLLRHSDAQMCWITAGCRDGTVELEVLNDGTRGDGSSERGSGLAGLAERARVLSGSVSAEPTGDDRFRLLVEIPDGRAIT